MYRLLIIVVTLLTVLFLPAHASWAQTSNTSAIAGVVTDSSQAVLPGVTVEAASPVLIEQVRTAVTDGQGRYRLIDLRPGTYTVTFSLQGFSSVRREAIELSGGFTATVDAALQVGAVTEVLTVRAASPLVDVQSARTTAVLKRDVLDQLPINRTLAGYVAVTPGLNSGASGRVTRDVGGSLGEQPQFQVIHGSDGGLLSIDGIKAMGVFQGRRQQPNYLITQEVVLETSAGDAEAWSGGPNLNIVTKDGGNQFSANVAAFYSGKGFDTNNLSDALRARGLQSYNEQKQHYDIGMWLGGPIVRDKLWFFVSPRKWVDEYYVAGNYFNATPHTLFYTPDLSRPAYSSRPNWDVSGKLTYQLNDKNKFNFANFKYYQCFCYSSVESDRTPDASRHSAFDPQHILSLVWTSPLNSRLLLEGGLAYHNDATGASPTEGQLPTDRAVFDAETGIWHGANFNSGGQADYGFNPAPQWLTRASLSYVTGSNSLKVGFTTFHVDARTNGSPFLAESYTFRGTVPLSITQAALPGINRRVVNTMGLFAQDQWTRDRLTVNLGLRFDSVNGRSPAQTRPAGIYLGEVSFPEAKNLPNWRDLSPRLGASFDLLGNGRTALKAALGRYVLASNIATSFTSPPTALVTSTSRTWSDANGDYVPDCDLTRKDRNGECGPMSNQAFGTSVVTTRPADEVREGWNVSPQLWQTSVSLQHQLADRVGLTVGYYRTWYGNITATDNLAVSAGDFSPYCITAPADSRLPGGGGSKLCGLYDVSVGKLGQVDNLIVNSNVVGGRSQVYQGVDVLFNARLGGGLTLSGGLSMGRIITDNCASPDVPGQFCRTEQPLTAGSDFKLSGVYPLPFWGLQTSATYQNLPGLAWTASYAAPNSLIAPSLGRNLSSCASSTGPCSSTATVQLIEPFSMFEPRGQQVDVRFSKIVRLRGARRVQASFDVYNLTNRGDVTSLRTGYGPTWSSPLSILAGRMFKIGAQVDF